ncbi:alkaline-phosphatase-like protein [Ilyonectria destructans]|nr:alkaline-phosphatase-like protein [Ilyonectria destructans]
MIESNVEFYRARMQTLQAVDDLINSVIQKLNRHPDVLANTYLIYTTDNGFHIRQYRLPPGKTCEIEEDIHIPFFIRGPGVQKRKTVSVPTTHTDIVPTIFKLAGIPLQEDFDGKPIPVTPEMQKKAIKIEHINVEYWGTSLAEAVYGNDRKFSCEPRHQAHRGAHQFQAYT